MPQRYIPEPDDCPELQAIDKLRSLLAEDALTIGRFQGEIGQFPLTSVRETDVSTGAPLPPAISLYSPMDDGLEVATVGGAGKGRSGVTYQCALEIALFWNQTATPDGIATLYRRLKNETYRFRRVLLKYRCDPTPAANGSLNASLWYALTFLKPATVLRGEVGTMMYTATRFTLSAHERMP